MNAKLSLTFHFALALLLIGGIILVFPAPSAAQEGDVIYYRTSPIDLKGQPATMVHIYRFFPDGAAVGGGRGFVGATIDSVWKGYSKDFVPGSKSVGTYTYSITGTVVTLFGTYVGKPITYTAELRDVGKLVVDYPKLRTDGSVESVEQFEYQLWRGPPLVPTGPVGSQGQRTRSSSLTRGNTPNSGDVGDPVSTSIGEYYFGMPLLDLGGPLPVRFALYYAANLDKSPGAHNDPFGGDNFSHNYYLALKRTSDATAVGFFSNGNLVLLCQFPLCPKLLAKMQTVVLCNEQIG